MGEPQPPSRYRVLVADDEESVLRFYPRAFAGFQSRNRRRELDELDAQLFSTSVVERGTQVEFDVVTCSQGNDAVDLFQQAQLEGCAFDVVILDIRMPPGINGVEAAERIRALDANVLLIIVTGFSDVAEDEIVKRVPPRSRLVYRTKPLSFSRLVGDIVAMLD